MIKNKNRGFTLIEILLVVGFIAIAGLGLYMVYDKLIVSNTSNEEAKNIKIMQSGIINLYGFSKNYASINIESSIAAKVTPENMKQTTTQLSNGFGGGVDVVPSSYNGFPNKSFSIIYNYVPRNICMRFVSLASVNSVQVTVNNIVVKDISGAEGADKKDLNVPATVAECDKVANSTIVFTFFNKSE